ncbi:hypothetical protein T492DRAFT_1091604 [Pavlovales sp. CCMP2436]|nr:hypothetical protein T492DRAFT_1091604 [Pavlovales sp. CCMP2436]
MPTRRACAHGAPREAQLTRTPQPPSFALQGPLWQEDREGRRGRGSHNRVRACGG